MIKFTNINQEAPYLVFKEKYDKSIEAKQKNIEAICISSYSKKYNEVNSRYVNLKIVNDKEFIFLTLDLLQSFFINFKPIIFLHCFLLYYY